MPPKIFKHWAVYYQIRPSLISDNAIADEISRQPLAAYATEEQQIAEAKAKLPSNAHAFQIVKGAGPNARYGSIAVTEIIQCR